MRALHSSYGHALWPRGQFIRSLGGMVLCLMIGQALVAQAHDRHHPEPSSALQETSVEAVQSRIAFPEVTLVNQRGEPVHWYRDLIKGKVVAINVVYPSCRTTCPLMGATFAELQKRLQEMGTDRTGQGMHLISVSVDPVLDTPQRLQAWGKQFHVGPGWTLLTGNKHDIATVLRALQVFTPDKVEHTSVVLIGNDAVGTWRRVNGLASPATLAQLLTEISHAPVHSSAPQEARPQ
jgi:protein SCO1/2